MTDKPPPSFETPGAVRAHTVTKEEHDALMKNRTRPLTDPHMSLHRKDAVAPDLAETTFGIHIEGAA